MTREEKAKAYDKALEWMRKVYPALTGADKEDAEYYFPELRESEDERIRKELYAVINDLVLPGEQRERFNAWLEKQKEQKPVELDEYKIIKKHITEDMLSSEVNKRLTECGWYVTDEKPVEWSEEDEHRYGDAIYFLETTKTHYADTSELEKCIEWLKGLQPTEGIKGNLEEIPSNVDLEKEIDKFIDGFGHKARKEE